MHTITGPFDHSVWDQFSKQFVNEKGEVDYAAVKKDPSLLDRYLKQLSEIEEFSDEDWPREEKLAVWLNLYHAGVIRMVVNHYPLKSIKDIPGVWDITFLTTAGDRISLNDIRARQLLGAYRDEKINVALSCGARGCPRLRQEAFTGPRVEGQLFLAAKEFVNDPERNEIIPEKKRVLLSSIFDWYAGDFLLDFGIFENQKGWDQNKFAVLSFLAHYLDDAEKIEFLEDGEYKVQYKPFDWSLNEWRRPQEKTASALPVSK